MSAEERVGRARLDADEVDEMEASLIDAEHEAVSGLPRMRGSAGSADGVPSVRREIIGIYRQGVEIASSVDVYPLPELLREAGKAVPPSLTIASHDHDFHLLQLVFSLRLPDGVKPVEAEFAVELSTGDAPPQVVSFFPPETRETLVKAAASAKVGLTGALNFAVPDEVAKLTGLPEASASVEVTSSFVVGPFNYEIRRARILANGSNQGRVQWKYLLAAELAGSSEFQSWIVLKSRKGVASLGIAAELGVLPYRTEWLVFKKYLKVMRDTLRVEVAL